MTEPDRQLSGRQDGPEVAGRRSLRRRARRPDRAPAGAGGTGRPEQAPSAAGRTDGAATPVDRTPRAAPEGGVDPIPPPVPRGRARRGSPEPDGRTGADSPRRRGTRADAAGERLLRSLVSTRPTQLSPAAAMRAREVGAPTPEDIARAEAEVVIVRRNYVPPAPLSTGRRPTRGRRPDGPRADQDGRNGGSGSSS